jgi:hypothetical protein
MHHARNVCSTLHKIPMDFRAVYKYNQIQRMHACLCICELNESIDVGHSKFNVSLQQTIHEQFSTHNLGNQGSKSAHDVSKMISKGYSLSLNKRCTTYSRGAATAWGVFAALHCTRKSATIRRKWRT